MKRSHDLITSLRTISLYILPFLAVALFYYIAGNRYGYMGFAMYSLFSIIMMVIGLLCLWSGRLMLHRKAIQPFPKENGWQSVYHIIGILGIGCMDVFYVIFFLYGIINGPMFLRVLLVWSTLGLAYLHRCFRLHRPKQLPLLTWLAPHILTLLIFVIAVGLMGWSAYQLYLCAKDIPYLKDPQLVELNDVTYTYHHNRKGPGNTIVKGYAWTGQKLEFDIGAKKPPNEKFTYAKIRYLPNTRCVIELYILER